MESDLTLKCESCYYSRNISVEDQYKLVGEPITTKNCGKYIEKFKCSECNKKEVSLYTAREHILIRTKDSRRCKRCKNYIANTWLNLYPKAIFCSRECSNPKKKVRSYRRP